MERERQRKLAEIETFAKTPPEVILVFDNYRGRGLEELVAQTMGVRAAIAALIYHSNLYSNQKKPFVCSFAGEHEEGGVAGSERVANHLGDFGVSSVDIVTRRNTITTTTDLMQLHAFMIANGLKTAAIVTTDDHVQRTKTEIENHFRRWRKHRQKPKIYVLSPSSEITNSLNYRYDGFDNYKAMRFNFAINVGRTSELDGGLTEKIATAIAKIPVRSLRVPIQKRAEQKSHPHTPVELQRIRKASQRFAPKRFLNAFD